VELQPFVLVSEGSIPIEASRRKATGRRSGTTARHQRCDGGRVNGRPKALAVLASGPAPLTAASMRWPQSDRRDGRAGSSRMGLEVQAGIPVVCVPGCPIHRHLRRPSPTCLIGPAGTADESRSRRASPCGSSDPDGHEACIPRRLLRAGDFAYEYVPKCCEAGLLGPCAVATSPSADGSAGGRLPTSAHLHRRVDVPVPDSYATGTSAGGPASRPGGAALGGALVAPAITKKTLHQEPMAQARTAF